MLQGYFPRITLPSGKSDVRKGDGLALIIDGKVMLLDAFEGGEPTNRLVNWLMEHIEPNENGTYVIDLLVISHIHGDHYGGGAQIANDSRFWIRKLLCYNPDSLAFRVDSTANGKALKKDIASFKAFLNNVRAKKTAVEYIDKGSVFQFADTTWKVWRKQPTKWTANDGGEAWAFVNDGSLALHCVETGLTYGGDGCDAIKEAIAQDGWKVSAVSVTHHGNSFEKSAAAATKSSGCMVAWQSCIERKGPGTTGWTTYGTQRLLQQGVPVWQQDADIFIEADGGQITVRQGSKSLTKEVGYHGWIHDSKGWKCGDYKDGAYQIGGKWYYFDADGYTITGFYKPDNCSRYLHPDYKGAMQIGWFQATDRQWYYADGYGRILTGWQEVGGNWYYLDPARDGMMLKDDLVPDWNGLHYVDGWGIMQKNCIVEHEGKQYYADGWGVIQTGWINTDGKWYCADETGAFRIGWYEDPDLGTRYLDPAMVVNETRTIDGKTYRFDGYGNVKEVTEKPATEPVEAETPRLNVIDIASYQSGLDLTKVKVDGVIIKATQGTTYVNPCCNKHYAQAKQTGILRGLYHYASGVGAAAEADAFVRNIQGYIGDALLALDWEGAQNAAFGKNDVQYCKTFLDRVYAITGVRPLIYMSKSVCRAHDWSSVAKDYGLWVAQYASMDPTGFQANPWTDNKGYGAWKYPAIYQYSSRGRLDGYSGNLDLDLAYMTRTAWGKYAAAKH